MKIKNRVVSFLTTIITLSSHTGEVNAQSIINGSMNGTSASTNQFNTIVPTAWTNIQSSDTINSSTNIGGTVWTTSPDGGNALHSYARSAAHPNGSSTEGASQVVSGLTIGQTYSIAFYQTISNQSFNSGSGDGFWEVKFGSSIQNSAIMSVPNSSSPGSWSQQQLLFTASAQSQTLQFLARDASDDETQLALDGVSIAAVPEPTSSLMIAFASGIMLLRRTRKK